MTQTYGPAEGMETLEEKKRREEEERLARERAEKAKRDRLCPECSKKVTNYESVFCDGKYCDICIVSDI